MSLQINRLRIILQPTELVRLKFHQAGLVYALIAEANGRALGIDPVLPDEILIEAVEQGRREIAPYHFWAFGMTLLAGSLAKRTEVMKRLRLGLKLVGSQPARPGIALGGNFRVADIIDLVAGRTLKPDTPPTPIAETHFQTEIDQALLLERWTLRFTMPLRIRHSKQGLWDKRDPKTGKPPKPELMNGHRFDLPVFLRKVAQRLDQIAISDPRIAPETDPATSTAIVRQSEAPAAPLPQIAENHLCWCDVSYSAAERKNICREHWVTSS